MAFGKRLGLGSGLRIGIDRGGLRDEVGPREWPSNRDRPGCLQDEVGPGEWPSNRDRPGWPWKLEQAGEAVFRNPEGAR